SPPQAQSSREALQLERTNGPVGRRPVSYSELTAEVIGRHECDAQQCLLYPRMCTNEHFQWLVTTHTPKSALLMQNDNLGSLPTRQRFQCAPTTPLLTALPGRLPPTKDKLQG